MEPVMWLSVLGQVALALLTAFVVAIFLSAVAMSLKRGSDVAVVSTLVTFLAVLFLFGFGASLSAWQTVLVVDLAMVAGWLSGAIANLATMPSARSVLPATDGDEDE